MFKVTILIDKETKKSLEFDSMKKYIFDDAHKLIKKLIEKENSK